MAKTYDTYGLKAIHPLQPLASWLRQDLPKASATTIVKGAPVKMASGLAVEWVNPTDADIDAFTMSAAENGKTTVEAIYAAHDVILELTFLGSAAADNVLAATDHHKSVDLAKGANLLGTGVAGWYASDTTADVAVKIVDFRSQYVFPTVNESIAVAGDTNARIRAHVLPGVSSWY